MKTPNVRFEIALPTETIIHRMNTMRVHSVDTIRQRMLSMQLEGQIIPINAHPATEAEIAEAKEHADKLPMPARDYLLADKRPAYVLDDGSSRVLAAEMADGPNATIMALIKLTPPDAKEQAIPNIKQSRWDMLTLVRNLAKHMDATGCSKAQAAMEYGEQPAVFSRCGWILDTSPVIEQLITDNLLTNDVICDLGKLPEEIRVEWAEKIARQEASPKNLKGKIKELKNGNGTNGNGKH